MPAAAHPYPAVVEEFPRIRQSILATFDQCRLLTKFELEYRKGWSNKEQARGQIFHRFAAKALTAMADAGETTIDPEDALAIMRETLRQADVEPRDVVTIPFSEIKDLRWITIKWAHENVFDTAHLADVEQRLQATVRYPHPAGGLVDRIISGQLDCLFVPEPDWAVVPDWKTGWALPPPSDLSEEGYFQQRCYALLVFHRFPSIERVTLREVYVRKKAEAGGSPVREATVFRSELTEIEGEMAGLAEQFDKAMAEGEWPIPKDRPPNLFPPSPGSCCNYCPRPTACPIFPDARNEGEITDAETAERKAAERVVARAALTKLDKSLKAWAGAKGPIPIKDAKDPDRVLGYKDGSRTEKPTKEQVERALADQGAGLDLDTLYRTSTSARWEAHSREEPDDAAADIELTEALEESIRRQESERARDT